MSTRGFIGLVVDGEEKIIYNHFDSYPDGLGMEMLTWLRDVLEVEKWDLKKVDWRGRVRNLKMVDINSTPTEDQILELAPWSDVSVSNQSLKDWYCLLRKTQGDLGATLAAGYAIDSSGFPLDSLFAEWGYVIDIDTETFEVYEGFQKKPHHRGRFAHRAPVDVERRAASGVIAYYPVALRAAWSFNAVPTGDEFLGVLTDPEDEGIAP